MRRDGVRGAADALAAAFVVPHPADHRALHPTLLQDMHGELVHQYAFFGGPVPEFEARIRDGGHLRTLAHLRAAARAQERAYLKTFRLSDAQIRRGHPLSRLAEHGWHLGRTAETLGTSDDELVRRIRGAGFASLLNAHSVARHAAETKEA
ncbi:hypothetical protein [Streptomyces sp. NPDC058280]|uniref:ARPP-2 domain-containing protein n=1 Tax=Streptomyces sp. NPDC058280 TaxID=3346419 RepID=UPI0036ECAA3A